MSEQLPVNCSECDIEGTERACQNPKGRGIVGCPTLLRKDLLQSTLTEYGKKVIAEFAHMASVQEAECFADREKRPFVPKPVKPRIQEIIEFAKKMGFKRLGLVFCSGLKREGRIVGRILDAKDFEVISVLCKVGCVPKEQIGVKESEKIRIGEFEAMCNPIMQAKIMNDAHTEFNIMIGLCVGHDSLFFKYSEAPTTVLAAKDRVSGHNPLGPIYTAESYYSRLLKG
jgi:uncharacterized metal-binding protein